MSAETRQPPATPKRPSIASFVLGLFTRNLPAKLAALVLALLVWFTVRQDITATHNVDQCRVVSALPPGLIWLDPPPDSVRVKFSGPRSRMNDILKDPEGTKISLKVQESDLVGQPRALLKFSIENGKIRHSYGAEVEMESVGGAPFELWVAALEEKTVRVNAPVVTGVPGDWTYEVKVRTQKVTVSGPRASLAVLGDLTPEPIDASFLFKDVAEPARITPDPYPLTLPPSFKEAHLTLPKGGPLLCDLVFPLAPKREQHVVPIFAYQVGQSGLTMALKEDDQVTKENGTYRIQLWFRGTESDLAALRAAIERESVRAYVSELERKGFKSGRTGSDFVDTADLHMEGLPSGVKNEPPGYAIAVEVK